MQPDHPPRAKRDTSWTRDGRTKGIYWRRRANGSKSWGYYADGKIHAAATRRDAIDLKAKAGLRKSAGFPAPDTRVLVRELAEEVREAKRRKLRRSSFAAFEFALDKILLPELGHLQPAQAGPDRIARLMRDLADRGLKPVSIRRYTSPLAPIFKLAVRRGIIPSSPLALLSEDERPSGGGVRDHYAWSTEEISRLIAAADDLGRRRDAQYNYAPLIHLLALTGMRVSEMLALRWADVDLFAGVLHVRSSLSRDGQLTLPKTAKGTREIPLGPGLVDMLVSLKPEAADDSDFVCASKRGGKPVSYWNFRRRGFVKALEAAGLDGKEITIHDLRSAAISLYAAKGLTLVEVAEIVGHADASVTAKHYARLFDRSDVAARVRAAQASISLD